MYQIADSACGCRNPISAVLYLAAESGLNGTLGESASNEEIMALLYLERADVFSSRKKSDYSYIHRELAKPDILAYHKLLPQKRKMQPSSAGTVNTHA